MDLLSTDGLSLNANTTFLDYDCGIGRVADREALVGDLPGLVHDVAAGQLEFLIVTVTDGSFLQAAAITSSDGRVILEWQRRDGGAPVHYRLVTTATLGGPRVAPRHAGYQGDLEVEGFTVEDAVQHFVSFVERGTPAPGAYLHDVSASYLRS